VAAERKRNRRMLKCGHSQRYITDRYVRTRSSFC
jgi:hypothetical protein